MSEGVQDAPEFLIWRVRLQDLLDLEEATGYGWGRWAQDLRSHGFGLGRMAYAAAADVREVETVTELLGLYGYCDAPQRRLISESLQRWCTSGEIQAPDLDRVQEDDELNQFMRQADEKPIVPAEATLLDPVTVLRGVGAAMAHRLSRLGITTLMDLIFHLPRKYEMYENLTLSQLEVGQTVSVMGRIGEGSVSSFQFGKQVRKRAVKARLRDGTGEIDIIWWNSWMMSSVVAGALYHMYGKVERSTGRLLLNNPQFVSISPNTVRRNLRLLDEGRMPKHSIMALYPLTQGITQAFLRKINGALLDADVHRQLADELPLTVRSRFDLPTVREAVALLHQPETEEEWQEARRYLAFQSLYKFQTDLVAVKAGRNQGQAPVLAMPPDFSRAYDEALPFSLTAEQLTTLQEILQDIAQVQPAFRLVRGEAGSGKTVVLAAALLAAARHGVQSALMAPTQLLATQHLESMQSIARWVGSTLDWPPIRVEMLSGVLSPAERTPILDDLATGDIQIAVGTTALLQPQVGFKRLGLVVIDEEHRFSVDQRRALVQPRQATEGEEWITPHVLSLSATPIPRSLNQVLTGYMDVSEIRIRPGHRPPVRTVLRNSEDRTQVYDLLRRQVARGQQGFVVYPQIEVLDELSDVGSLDAEYEWLARDVFPDLRLAKVHGGMPKGDIHRIMEGFRDRTLDILVSTTVIEVGIDVPNATMMVIENAERFGLAQLHQLRNRVGRGTEPGTCVLLSESRSAQTGRRLNILLESDSGFAIAERDLEMRGPGDLLGKRQSGAPEIPYVNFIDAQVLDMVRECFGAAEPHQPTHGGTRA